MQGMFGASVSELYLLIKSLIYIGRAVDLCVRITKKKIHSLHRNCKSGLASYDIQACCTQAGPAYAAGRGGGNDR